MNKFYVLDLTPDKSMTRYLVSQGYRVFSISCFNPGPSQENWGLEDYVSAIIEATGDECINCCTLQVCVLEPRSDDTDMGALVTETSIEFARSKSAKKGILSGQDLATTFAWMRPNDLIWN